MGAGRPLLHPAYVKRARGKLDLVPTKVHKLGGPKAVPVGHYDHRGVAVSPTVLPGRRHQPLDLGLGQVLSGAQLAVGGTLGGNCSIYGGWLDQLQVPFGHAFFAPCSNDCSNNARSSNRITKRATTHCDGMTQLDPKVRASSSWRQPEAAAWAPYFAPVFLKNTPTRISTKWI